MSSARVRRGPALIRLVLFIQEREMCNYNYAKDTRSIGSKSLLFHETSEDDQSVTTFSREKINGDPPSLSDTHGSIDFRPSLRFDAIVYYFLKELQHFIIGPVSPRDFVCYVQGS
jgi:hypothetical protein